MSLKSKLIQYANDVISGKVIACSKYKQAAERLLSDFGREETDKDFPYVFKEENGERFLKFVSFFRHGKGELQGKPIDVCDYYRFSYGQVFGWVHKDNGTLRFNKFYQQLARKNNKSTMMALVAIYHCCCMGEEQAEIFIAATTKEQTRHVYSAAENFINRSVLKKSFKIGWDDTHGIKLIRHNKSNSIITRLSRDQKSREGSMASVGILDEWKEHLTTEFRDNLLTGMKTRKGGGIMYFITTAGSPQSPCYQQEYLYSTKILNGILQDDKFLCIIAEADINETPDTITVDGRQIKSGEPLDVVGSRESILKANPVSGYTESFYNNVLEEVKTAQNVPELYNTILTRTFNIWVQSRPMGFMDMARWKNCATPPAKLLKTIKESGGKCYVGYDLSSRIDMTSASFLFPYMENDIKKWCLFSHSWIPREKLLDNKDKVPYDKWERDGYLTVHEGALISHKDVVEWVYDICKKHGWEVAEYCLDSWNAGDVMTMLLDDADNTVIEVRQNLQTLSGPTRMFREQVYAQNIIHDNNPVLSWAVGNCTTRQDNHGNFILDKRLNREKIDPVSATITAFTRASVVELEPKESFGVMFF